MVAPRFGVISSMLIPIGGTLANIVLFNFALYKRDVFPVNGKKTILILCCNIAILEHRGLNQVDCGKKYTDCKSC